ncbi:hypothetical protein LMG29542_04834 [Paraburkholderia humisilvae]|uniref:Uncharacterized protein n=1 Tax=Paraburkholderia humisilvae TaxID=627669 RepID=A0A6J5EG08_9BURK|nr:hypothetical protein LMG29542_04834 [Paraburkholderia humisilvae]
MGGRRPGPFGLLIQMPKSVLRSPLAALRREAQNRL